jgi:hypothetical protein
VGRPPRPLAHCCAGILTTKPYQNFDLWVMRRMAPVPCLPSDPSTSRLSTAYRPWCPIRSSLSCRCPQRPYYCFYYDRPWIISENSARRPAHGDDLARWKLCGSPVDSVARPRGTSGAASPDRAGRALPVRGLSTGSRSLSISPPQQRSLRDCERQRAQARVATETPGYTPTGG